MVQPELRDSIFIASDNRENFKQVIAKRSDLVQRDRGRLAPSMAGTVQEAGLVLGLASSGGDAGFYKAYASGNTDGSQVAVGVLEEQANVASTPASGAKDGSEVLIMKVAVLFKDLLIGYDATAKSNLNAHEYSEGGVNLVRINA